MPNDKAETTISNNYDDLEGRACAKNIPVYAQLELTYKCNLKCLHCYTDQGLKREVLSTQEVKNIIDQLVELGALYLIFTGGELFLRKDWFEIASYARQKGFVIRFFTNATLITPGIAKKIYDLKPLLVETSLYGQSAKTHDKITQIPGSFALTIDGVKHLVNSGVKVLVKTMAMKENISEITGMKELVENIGAGFRADPVLMPKTDCSTAPLGFRISNEDLYWYYKNIDSKWEIKKQYPNKPICNAGKGVMLINPFGEVFPCVRIPLKAGDLRKQSFHEIWTKSPVLQEIRELTLSKVKECASCNDKIYCNTCPGLALVEQGDLYLPPRECCRQAKFRRKAMTS